MTRHGERLRIEAGRPPWSRVYRFRFRGLISAVRISMQEDSGILFSDATSTCSMWLEVARVA